MHVIILAESIDDMMLLGHEARIVWVSNTCKFFDRIMDVRIIVGHVECIKWVFNSRKRFGRNHR
jgi:hypothetical protein